MKPKERRRGVRVVSAGEGVGMTEAQAKRFLVESRSVVKLGTIDASGDPNVHPVWYVFEPKEPAIYALVGKATRKLRNIEVRGKLYFDVDQDAWPYRGVRGKGDAEMLPLEPRTMGILEKMLARYIKKKHPMHEYFVDSVKAGRYVIVKIAPRYFSTWDYGKMDRESLRAGLNMR